KKKCCTSFQFYPLGVLTFREQTKLRVLHFIVKRFRVFRAPLHSEQSGFNSQHYFSTVFRKMTGMTPKEYRGEG
ncbi:AraC family transcriptional regulator, partial [Bacillus thuringiensis]